MYNDELEEMESKEFENKLIELVKMHPLLYDHNNPFYKNNTQRQHIWNLISEEMEVPSKIVQYNWKKIRSSFYNNLKEKPASKSAAGRKRKTFGNRLDFLKSYSISSEITDSNMPAVTDAFNTSADKVIHYEKANNIIRRKLEDSKNPIFVDTLCTNDSETENFEIENEDEFFDENSLGLPKTEMLNKIESKKMKTENKLIELVEMHPLLYDRNNPYYKNNTQRQHIWNFISEEMKVPSKRVQYYWKNIRSSFYNNLKEKSARKSSAGRKRKTFGNRLDFLKSYSISSEVTDSNMPAVTDTFNTSADKVIHYEKDNNIIRRKLEDSKNLIFVDKLYTNNNETENFEIENEDDFFDENLTYRTLALQKTEMFNKIKSKKLKIENKLIELVKMHPLLYDHNNPFYKNNAQRQHIWNFISEEMQIPSKILQYNWRKIRSSFYNNLKDKSARKSSAGRKTKTFGNSLDFLKSTSISSDKTENFEMENEDEFIDENINCSTSLASPKTEMFNKIESKKLEMENEDELIDENINYSTSLASPKTEMFNKIESKKLEMENEVEFIDENINYSTSLASPKTEMFNKIESKKLEIETEDALSCTSLALPKADIFNDNESVLNEDSIFHDYRDEWDDIEEFLKSFSNAFRQIKSREERERIKVEIWKIFRTNSLNERIESSNSLEQTQNILDDFENQDISEADNNESLNLIEHVNCEYFKCNFCDEMFKTKEELSYHSDVHTISTGLKCTYCRQIFKTKKYLIRHELMHENRELVCKICNKQLKKKENLKFHMRIHTGERPHKCDLCPAAFSNLSTLRSHHIFKHTNDYNFPCTYDGCSRTFKLKTLMLKHYKSHMDIDNYDIHSMTSKLTCSYCPKTFIQKDFLIRHELIHENRVLSCKLCNKLSKSKAGLTRHMRIHTGERPYKCELCPAAFAGIGSLKSHNIFKHTNDYNFPCTYDGCTKKFKLQSLMVKHYKYLHLREKNYQCEKCGLDFLTSSKLSVHNKRDHLDYSNRPHPCNLCGKKFILKRCLRDHLNTHTGEKPYKCNFNNCYRGFAKKSGLREHKKIHTGQKKHICPICGKAFAQKAGQSNHMKYH